MFNALVISCEHAGNNIPEQYKYLFHQAQEILSSHRGWDPGAWQAASQLGNQLNTIAQGCFTTRLLIEANRSLNNPQLFSEYTQSLNEIDKQLLINQYYLPYRNNVKQQIDQAFKPCLHLSIHSFTPVWQGQSRKVDIGILFDPTRSFECDVSEQLRLRLKTSLPGFAIEFNEPYKGTDDGFTTYLRTCYTDKNYAGLEIEINQKYSENITPIVNALANAVKSLS